MKNSSRFVAGVLLILIGLIFLVDQTGFFSRFGISIWKMLWTFWPLILIFLGVNALIKGNNSGGMLLLILGIVFLSSNLFGWNFFAVLWPVIIITVGISILFKKEKASINSVEAESSKDESISETVLFWGVDKKIVSKNFKGGELNVAFGGCSLDLREAKISKEGAKLHVNCAFGGVEIFVPKDCRVKTNGTGFLGAWEPKLEENSATEPVLEISGGVAFGGVEIK